MSKPNGRQKKAIEGLATALQECFDASTEKANGAAERAQHAAERAERAVDRLETGLKPTLRMIWKQCGGKPDQRLPIDD